MKKLVVLLALIGLVSCLFAQDITPEIIEQYQATTGGIIVMTAGTLNNFDDMTTVGVFTTTGASPQTHFGFASNESALRFFNWMIDMYDLYPKSGDLLAIMYNQPCSMDKCLRDIVNSLHQKGVKPIYPDPDDEFVVYYSHVKF